MAKRHGKTKFKAILHSDLLNRPIISEPIRKAASIVFSEVIDHYYPCPIVGWPSAPNEAFRSAISFMPRFRKEWLWFEPDCIPIQPYWMEAIEEAYRNAGQAFFGPCVGGPGGHLNGTSVYPPDVARFSKHFLLNRNIPFDVALRKDVVEHHADASRLIQHCGAIRNGCCVTEGYPVPTFPTAESIDVVNWTTVLFHPNKDGTLIDRLDEMIYKVRSPWTPSSIQIALT